MKASYDQSVAIGWHAEAFKRTENLKPLMEYLAKPETGPAQKNEGASNLLALFKAKAKKAPKPASTDVAP